MRTSYTEGELLTKDDIGLVFKSRSGEQWKLIALLDSRMAAILVNFENKSCRHLRRNGKSVGKEFQEYITGDDLVSFVGPEFSDEVDKKVPRKFEFEGYIYEDKESKSFVDIYAIPTALRYCASSPFIKPDPFREKSNMTKWKFTMEEILDESP